MTQKSIEQIDRNFAPIQTTPDTVWYDIKNLGVENRGWSDVESFYDRLPARAKPLVRPDVWHLSQHSTGLAVRFVATTSSISARWTLRSKVEGLAMPHMPATGVSGLDLYARPLGSGDAAWRHAANGRPGAVTNSVVLLKDADSVPREFMLFLPLYNGVESVHIGLPPTVTLSPAPARPASHAKPIVIYGTSVTQGGCASRPGMVYSAILNRWLGRPVINLGFSGNGRMEMEVAQFLTELDPCLYVLDCLGNLEAPGITERTEPVVHLLRKAHPTIPIAFLGHIPSPGRFFSVSGLKRYQTSNAANEAAFARLVAAGVPNLHYIPGEDFYGHDGEATVDGGHATDLGFLRMAQVLAPALQKLL
jgi:hypothetical protein